MPSTVLLTEVGYNSTSGAYEIEVFNNLTTIIFDTDLLVYVDGVYTNTAWSVTNLGSKKYAKGIVASAWPDGAVIELRRSDSTLLDAFAYGYSGTAPDPLPTESIARTCIAGEYSNNWTRCASPTFGRANDNTIEISSDPELIINEVLFNPNAQDAFVELYYRGAGAIDFALTNYYLIGDSEYAINSGLVSTSSRYLTIYNSSLDGLFNLTSSKNNIYLYSNDGRRLDIAGWSTLHEPDMAMARLHDGTGYYNGLLGSYPSIISYNSTAYDDASAALAGWIFDLPPTPNGTNDRLPVLSGFLPSYNLQDGAQTNITISATDADLDNVTLEVGYENVNSSASLLYQLHNVSLTEWALSFNVSYANLGAHRFFVNATDGFVQVTSTIDVMVYHIYSAPYFDLGEISPITTAVLGSAYVCDLHARDNDTAVGDIIHYYATGPQYFTIDSAGLAVWPVVGILPGTSANVSINATDDSGLSAYLNYSIIVLASTNSAPYFTSDPVNYANVGEQYVYNFTAYDADGDALSFAIENVMQGAQPLDPSEMGMTLSNGSLIWLPGVQFANQTVVVTLNVTDGSACTSQTFSIFVAQEASPINYPPYFTSDPVNFAYVGKMYEYDANATDPEGASLTYALVSIVPLPAALPSVNASTGLVSWLPTSSEANLTFQLTINVTDGANVAEQTFEITVPQLHIPNRPPSLAALPTITTQEDERAYVNLSEYANDPDGDALTFYILGGNMSLFSWSVAGTNLTLVPAKNAYGESNFTLFVFDDEGARNQTTARIVVIPVNDPPIIKPPIGSISTEEGQEVTLNLANYEYDVDNSHEDLQWYVTSDATNIIFEYTLEHTPDATWFTITPISSGQANITFVLRDLGADSASCVVTLIVAHVNRAPVIDALPSLQVKYDRDYTFDFAPYVHDEDNETSELTISTSTIYARANESGNMRVTFNYPFSFQNQTFIVFITVSDGIQSATGMVNVTVKGNEPPIVTSPIGEISLAEDTTLLAAIKLSEHFSDPDQGSESLFYSCHGNRNVIVSISDSGIVDIMPVADWFGTENVTFRAMDPNGAITECTAKVVVTPVNDPPVVLIPAQFGTEGRNWTIDLEQYIFDIDNPFSQLVITEDSPYVTIVGKNAIFSYPVGHRSDFVTFTVSDGANSTSQTVDVTIRPNSAPVISGIPDISVRYGVDYKLSLLPYVYDPDGDVVQIFNLSSNYIRYGAGIGPIEGYSELAMQLVILLNYPYNISHETVVLTVWDGSLKSSATFNVTISDNYPPVVVMPIPDLYLREDVPSLGALDLSNYFEDPDDGGAMTYQALGWHFVTISISGNVVSLNPSKDYNGIELVTFRATDVRGAFVEYSINVHVIPVDDPPYFTDGMNATIMLNVGELRILDLLSYVGDVDTPDSDLVFSVKGENAAVSLNRLYLQYSKGGAYSLIVTVRDRTSAVSKVVHVNVTTRNYPPVYTAGLSDMEVILGSELYIDLNMYFFDVENDANLTFKCNTARIEIRPNGTAYWKPKKGDSNLYDVRFTASDGLANATSPPINLTIVFKSTPAPASNLTMLALLLVALCAASVLIYFVYRRATREPFVVEEVFLIHSDGRLISHQTRRLKPDFDADIIAGMFVAIQDFIKKSFMQDSEFRLGKLEFGDQKITIDRGNDIFIAVSYSGEASEDLSSRMKIAIRAIEKLYSNKLKAWDGDLVDVKHCKTQLNAIVLVKPSEDGDLVDVKHCKTLMQGLFSGKKGRLVKEVADGAYTEKDLDKLANGEKPITREVTARDLSEKSSPKARGAHEEDNDKTPKCDDGYEGKKDKREKTRKKEKK